MCDKKRITVCNFKVTTLHRNDKQYKNMLKL